MKEGKQATKRTCSRCEYHCYEEFCMGFVCVNADSDMCADWTPSDYSCEHFAPKKRMTYGKD